MSENKEETAVQMPWLLFKAQDQTFAINSQYVMSIFQLTEHTPAYYVPDLPEYIRGFLSQRNQILSLVDFRSFLGMPTMKQMYEDFFMMLDARKADHIHWINELERSLASNEPFLLATDPHQCAFGRWYYNYSTTDRLIQAHMQKIEEPHRKLHESALAALECNHQCSICGRAKCLKEVTRLAAEVYMPRLLSLLEEAKTIFKDQHREMCIILRQGETLLGLAVDEILEVEMLQMQEGGTIPHFQQSKLIARVTAQEGIPGQILVLNEQELFVILR